MPRISLSSFAEILRGVRPHLGQPNFPHALYRVLREQVGRSVAVAVEDLHFPERLPKEPPRFDEMGVRAWWPAGRHEALEELLRMLVRAHVTISELREELLAIEDQSSRKAHTLSMLAHEIKNPLFAVLGSLELLAQKPLDDEVQKLIAAARASVQRMRDLVNDSLQLASLEQEGVRLKAQRLSLNDLLRGLAGEVEPVALASGVHLRVVPLRGDAELLGDRRWLLQALLNLALNAVKYTPKGGRVILRAFRESGRVGFLVEDTGPGIAEEDQERIFQPFQRVDAQKEGSGLGLAIVKRVVEAHGGQIEVESRKGRGSRFRVELPRLTAGRRSLWSLRMLVLAALAAIAVARLPLYPETLTARTPAGAVLLGSTAELPQGGLVALGDARLRFDPGSRVRLRARRSLWGGGLKASLAVLEGGVGVERSGPTPQLEVGLRHARLEPRGTEFYAESGESDRVSLFGGSLMLSAPGFQGELAPGEGAVVSADGVARRKLLPAPQVRAGVGSDGRLELRWQPVQGAVRYRVELLEGEVPVEITETASTRWVYTPQADRDLKARVRALDDLGLAGQPSQGRPYRERGSYFRGRRAFAAGDNALAAQLLARAVELDPALAPAWYELGLARLELGEVRAAREALERAVELEPALEERVMLPLARALESAGEVGDAVAVYERAQSREELAREATLGLLRLLGKQGEARRVEDVACAWLQDHPGDEEVAAILRAALDAADRRYAKAGCPVFQKPPAPKPRPRSRPAPPPRPTRCNPFCN